MRWSIWVLPRKWLSCLNMLMQQPEYTTNPDTAPEAEFSSNEGRKSEGGGVRAVGPLTACPAAAS